MRALAEDMYHTFLDAKISVQLFFFLVLYVVLFWLYAFIYLFISASAVTPPRFSCKRPLGEIPCQEPVAGSRPVLVTFSWPLPHSGRRKSPQPPRVPESNSSLQTPFSKSMIGMQPLK